MSRRTPLRAASILIVGTLMIGSMGGGIARAAVTVEQGTSVSFDGTNISYTLFVPDVTPAPVIFMTHGWGGSRVQDPANGTVKMLTDEGYAVLTWDARGFGTSGGEANVDSQEFEVRDVQALIDIAGADARILTDAEGDPRMGMLGGSYAGGIQLMTAAADARVDAIIPQITWNDLPQSLKPGGVLKLGWDLLLYGAGLATALTAGLPAETGAYNAHIHQSLVEGTALNDWSTGTYNWFDSKSPKHYINGATLGDGTVLPGIRAATFLIQGTNDTLFPINQAIANYEAIEARGVPVKMLWFCGGHTGALIPAPLYTASCTAGPDFAEQRDSKIKAWLERYVKGDLDTVTGPAIEYQLQDGTVKSVSSLPTDTMDVFASTKVTNTVVPTSGRVLSGTAAGCHPAAGRTDCPLPPQADWIPIGTLTGPPGPKGCVPEPDPEHPEKPLCEPTFEKVAVGTQILGAPRVRVRVNSTAPETYLFFKLVDYDSATKTAVVVDDQVMALKSTWAGLATPRAHTLELAAVAWELKAGHELFLEVSPTSNDHASSRIPGSASLLIDATIPYIAAP